ncbi:transposase [Natrinema versiforme]
MVSLFRVFMLKDCYGWDHETALVEYLNRYPVLCDQLGLETVPDQSTLWRSWNKRFTANDLASGGPAGTGRVDR